MPIPRVFISSTCYDLKYIRENLKLFINNMGFDSVLSEEGNIYYDPKKHAQEACLAEVPTCQILVLIIGGRFGASFKNKIESVTNYEYRKAVESKIPIFALVEQRVYSDFLVYQRNVDNPDLDATKIEYPSVDSILIFDFIKEVQGNAVNNALFPFSDYGEMESYLKQQWGGMLFSYLSQEGESKRVASLLETLTIMSKRIEFLSSQILSSVGTDKAKVMAELYDIMLKYECIRDLAYFGVRPAPKEILQTKEYKNLGKGKWKIDYSPSEYEYSVSGAGEMSASRYEKNRGEYEKLRGELLKVLNKARIKISEL